MAALVAHLPGKHDQSTHARGGESGFDDATTGDAAIGVAALSGPLSPAQAEAIDRYGGDGSYVINADLRSTGGSTDGLTAKNKATVEQLDSVMSAAPLKSDIVVHRVVDPTKAFGRNITSADPDVTGLSWRDNAYTSTSVTERGTGRVRLRILAKKGTPGFSHPSLDSDEVVLDRGLKFTVVKDHGPEVVRRLDVVIDQ